MGSCLDKKKLTKGGHQAKMRWDRPRELIGSKIPLQEISQLANFSWDRPTDVIVVKI
jgi:hypothetical protein